ncbi:MAG: c-type cytochrome [Pseudobdellovibrio sp.]
MIRKLFSFKSRPFHLFFALFILTSCGKKASDQSSIEQSSTADSSTNNSNSVPPAASDHSAPHITAVTANIIAYTNVEFKVNEDVPLSNATYSWSHSLDGAAGACLVISGSTSQNYIINCTKDGNLKVSVQIMQAGSQVAVQDYLVPMAASSTVATASLSASFSITAGTGSKAWNTAAAPIEVYVGQTLTVTNNDTVKHQMHTGGKPCPHGAAIATGGGTGTCVITQAYNSITSAGVYEHTVGTSAPIYIIAYDGSQLYSQNCMSCHGALAASQHKNATYAQILNAIANVPTMSSNAALTKLTKKQVEAIAYALSK